MKTLAALVGLLMIWLASIADAAKFIPLGFLPGGDASAANDISADGRIVVGESDIADGGQAFRWSESTGMVGLGVFPDSAVTGTTNSTAWGISADGSIIVGEGMAKAFKWTAANGHSSLGLGRAVGVSNDGFTIVGFGDVIAGNAVTPDGDTWVGSADFGSGQEAFRTTSSGTLRLGDIPGFDYASVALGVSADGSVVVGQSNAFLDPDGRGHPVETTVAMRWTSAEGMVPIGDLPGGGHGSTARDVSADGSVIVGSGEGAIGSEAYRWTAASGIVSLRQLLLDEGIDVRSLGWELKFANAVSANGRVIVGTGFGPGSANPQAWLVELPIPEPAAAALFAIGVIAAISARRIARG